MMTIKRTNHRRHRSLDELTRKMDLEQARADDASLMRRLTVARNACFALGALLILTAIAMAVLSRPAPARDLDGRYAQSPLREWFDHLASRKGLCCSFADGTSVEDPDWEARDGHYRVRLEGQWWDVPEEAVITEPNRAGRTMVWPIVYRNGIEVVSITIRCFIPGSMT